jgi:drug/metabolite transporter (DMT)-like permease
VINFNQMKHKTLLLTIIAGIAGGTIPTYSKIAIDNGMSSGELTVARYVFTTIALVIIVLVSRQNARWKNIKAALPISILAAINAMCFAIAIKYIQTASIQLLYTIIPMIVAALSWIILRQKTNLSKIIGLVIGLLGVGVVIIAPIFESGNGLSFSGFGVLIVLFASVCYSFYTVLSKPLQQKSSPSEILIACSIMTIISQVIFSLITKEPLTFSTVSANSLGAALVVGLIGTTLLYSLVQYIVKYGSPLEATLNLYIMPIFSAVVAFTVLGQGLSLLAVLGGVLALIGVAQVNGLWKAVFSRKKQKLPIIPIPE